MLWFDLHEPQLYRTRAFYMLSSMYSAVGLRKSFPVFLQYLILFRLGFLRVARLGGGGGGGGRKVPAAYNSKTM